MKELEHCSQCDRKLIEDDKDRNRECGTDFEEWTCFVCDNDSDSMDDY